MKKKAKFKLSDARKSAEKMQSGGGPRTIKLPKGVEMFRVEKAGKYYLDFIPFTAAEGNPNADAGEAHYERTYYVHRNIGANNDMVICLSKTTGKKCPVCQFRSKLEKGEDADEETVKDLLPKRRQLFNVVDTKRRKKGIQILDISYHLLGELLTETINEGGSKWRKFHSPTEGFTLCITFKKKKWNGNVFFEAVNISLVRRKKQYDESIVDEAPCLDEILEILSYDDLKEKMEGGDLGEDSDDAPKKGKKSKKDDDEDEDEDDVSYDDDDEEDEDEEDVDEESDDDEDEEDDEPKSKKKSKKSKKDDDDEEDEDEEDDEDEDEEEESDDDEDEDSDDEEDEDEEDDEEEDDEEDDEDDEEEDDEDEKPKKGKKKDDEDEDEDEEDDEDEEFEEELPKKKKKKK
jgi:hypothetical protein